MIDEKRDSKIQTFQTLRLRVGSDLVGLWDIYTRNGMLIHVPISSLNFDELETARARLGKAGFILVTTEAVQTNLIDHDEDSRRKLGSFRRRIWYNASFQNTSKPNALASIEWSLEKESKWLSGGPRPTNGL